MKNTNESSGIEECLPDSEGNSPLLNRNLFCEPMETSPEKKIGSIEKESIESPQVDIESALLNEIEKTIDGAYRLLKRINSMENKPIESPQVDNKSTSTIVKNKNNPLLKFFSPSVSFLFRASGIAILGTVLLFIIYYLIAPIINHIVYFRPLNIFLIGCAVQIGIMVLTGFVHYSKKIKLQKISIFLNPIKRSFHSHKKSIRAIGSIAIVCFSLCIAFVATSSSPQFSTPPEFSMPTGTIIQFGAPTSWNISVESESSVKYEYSIDGIHSGSGVIDNLISLNLNSSEIGIHYIEIEAKNAWESVTRSVSYEVMNSAPTIIISESSLYPEYEFQQNEQIEFSIIDNEFSNSNYSVSAIGVNETYELDYGDWNPEEPISFSLDALPLGIYVLRIFASDGFETVQSTDHLFKIVPNAMPRISLPSIVSVEQGFSQQIITGISDGAHGDILIAWEFSVDQNDYLPNTTDDSFISYDHSEWNNISDWIGFCDSEGFQYEIFDVEVFDFIELYPAIQSLRPSKYPLTLHVVDSSLQIHESFTTIIEISENLAPVVDAPTSIFLDPKTNAFTLQFNTTDFVFGENANAKLIFSDINSFECSIDIKNPVGSESNINNFISKHPSSSAPKDERKTAIVSISGNGRYLNLHDQATLIVSDGLGKTTVIKIDVVIESAPILVDIPTWYSGWWMISLIGVAVGIAFMFATLFLTSSFRFVKKLINKVRYWFKQRRILSNLIGLSAPNSSTRHSSLSLRTRVTIKSIALVFITLGIPSIMMVSAAPKDPELILGVNLECTYGYESGVTGYIESDYFKIHMFDTLNITYIWDSVNTDLVHYIKIENLATPDADPVYEYSEVSNAVIHTHIVEINPLIDMGSFALDTNYTLSIYTMDGRRVISYSNPQTIEIIKTNAMIVFPDDEFGPRGLYIVDRTDELTPSIEYHYECSLIDIFTQRPIPSATLHLELLEGGAGYTPIGTVLTDIEGSIDISENRGSFIGTYLRVTFDGDSLYNNIVAGDSRNPEHIYSSWDYTEPESDLDISIINDELSTTDVTSIIDQRTTYSWYNNESTHQGFTLYNVDPATYTFGVVPEWSALYFGTISEIDLTGTIVSPMMTYYGTSVDSANLTLTLSTVRDTHSSADPLPPSDIFTINVALYDIDFNLLDYMPVYTGNMMTQETFEVPLDHDLFTEPRQFRIGLEIEIITNDYYGYDSPDSWYVFLHALSAEFVYDRPRFVSASHLNSWEDYTTGELSQPMQYNSTSQIFSVSSGQNYVFVPDMISEATYAIESPLDFLSVPENTSMSFDLDVNVTQIAQGSDDATGRYTLSVWGVLDNGSLTESLILGGDDFSINTSIHEYSVDIEHWQGQNVSQISIWLQFSLPQISDGFPDLFTMKFAEIQIVNDTQGIPILIDASDLFTPNNIIVDASIANEIVDLAIPEQSIEANGFGTLYCQTEEITSVILSNTQFSGSVDVKIKGYMDSWDDNSTGVYLSTQFELWIKFAEGYQRIATQEIWNRSIDNNNMGLQEEEEISVDLGSLFSPYMDYSGESFTSFFLRYYTTVTPMESNDSMVFIPSCGVEISQSWFVLEDLPPLGDWQSPVHNDILSGVVDLTIEAQTADIEIARVFLWEEGGIPHMLGNLEARSGNTFGYTLDSTDCANITHDGWYYLLAEFKDYYGVSNTSRISVYIDNTPAQISYNGSIHNGDVIVQPQNISVVSDSDDIHRVEFLITTTGENSITFGPYDYTYSISNNGTTEYGFVLDPELFAPATSVNIEATAYDRTNLSVMAGYAAVYEVILGRFNPEFFSPSPSNCTGMVTGLFTLNFSMDAHVIDLIEISVADVSTHIPEATAYSSIYNFSMQQDYYSLTLNSIDVWGNTAGFYIIEITAIGGNLTDNFYWVLYVDNQWPEIDISFDPGTEISPAQQNIDLLNAYVQDQIITTVPTINGDVLTVALGKNFTDDLVLLEYFVESLTNTYTDNLVDFTDVLNYSAIAQIFTEEEYDGVFPTTVQDGWTFFSDMLNGLEYTIQMLQEMVAQGDLINVSTIFPVNPQDENFAYLQYIETYMSNFPAEYINDGNATIAAAVSSMFSSIYSLFGNIDQMEGIIELKEGEVSVQNLTLTGLYADLLLNQNNLAQTEALLNQAVLDLATANDYLYWSNQNFTAANNSLAQAYTDLYYLNVDLGWAQANLTAKQLELTEVYWELGNFTADRDAYVVELGISYEEYANLTSECQSLNDLMNIHLADLEGNTTIRDAKQDLLDFTYIPAQTAAQSAYDNPITGYLALISLIGVVSQYITGNQTRISDLGTDETGIIGIAYALLEPWLAQEGAATLRISNIGDVDTEGTELGLLDDDLELWEGAWTTADERITYIGTESTGTELPSLYTDLRIWEDVRDDTPGYLETLQDITMPPVYNTWQWWFAKKGAFEGYWTANDSLATDIGNQSQTIDSYEFARDSWADDVDILAPLTTTAYETWEWWDGKFDLYDPIYDLRLKIDGDSSTDYCDYVSFEDIGGGQYDYVVYYTSPTLMYQVVTNAANDASSANTIITTTIPTKQATVNILNSGSSVSGSIAYAAYMRDAAEAAMNWNLMIYWSGIYTDRFNLRNSLVAQIGSNGGSYSTSTGLWQDYYGYLNSEQANYVLFNTYWQNAIDCDIDSTEADYILNYGGWHDGFDWGDGIIAERSAAWDIYFELNEDLEFAVENYNIYNDALIDHFYPLQADYEQYISDRDDCARVLNEGGWLDGVNYESGIITREGETCADYDLLLDDENDYLDDIDFADWWLYGTGFTDRTDEMVVHDNWDGLYFQISVLEYERDITQVDNMAEAILWIDGTGYTSLEDDIVFPSQDGINFQITTLENERDYDQTDLLLEAIWMIDGTGYTSVIDSTVYSDQTGNKLPYDQLVYERNFICPDAISYTNWRIYGTEFTAMGSSTTHYDLFGIAPDVDGYYGLIFGLESDKDLLDSNLDGANSDVTTTEDEIIALNIVIGFINSNITDTNSSIDSIMTLLGENADEILVLEGNIAYLNDTAIPGIEGEILYWETTVIPDTEGEISYVEDLIIEKETVTVPGIEDEILYWETEITTLTSITIPDLETLINNLTATIPLIEDDIDDILPIIVANEIILDDLEEARDALLVSYSNDATVKLTEAYDFLVSTLRPSLTGMHTNASAYPLGEIIRVPVQRYVEYSDAIWEYDFNLGSLPDGWYKFGARIMDGAGHYQETITDAYFIDTHAPKIVLNSPSVGEQIVFTTSESIILEFEMSTLDLDIANINLISLISENGYGETLSLRGFQQLPNKQIRFYVYLDEISSQLLLDGAISNPKITWAVNCTDLGGKTTTLSSYFYAVSEKDVEAPEVRVISGIDPYVAYIGSEDIILNITDDHFAYVEVWMDYIPECYDAREIYYWISDVETGTFALNDAFRSQFIGIVDSAELDELYHINPYMLGSRFADLAPGSHTIILRIFDQNWNEVILEFEITTLEPKFTISSGSILHTDGINQDLTIALDDSLPSADIVQITYKLYDASIFAPEDPPLYSVVSVDSGNNFVGTWTGVIESDYWLVYEILFSDSHTISNFHSFTYPNLAGIEFGTDLIDYIPFYLSISDAIPHEVMIDVIDGTIFTGDFDIGTTWLGTGEFQGPNHINDGSVALWVDDELFAYEEPPTVINSKIFSLGYLDLDDGAHEIQIIVTFANQEIGTSEIVSIIVDNSAPLANEQDLLLQNEVLGLPDTIFSNGSLWVDFTIFDPETTITFLEMIITDEVDIDTTILSQVPDSQLYSYSDKLDITSLVDGDYTIVLRAQSTGGTIEFPSQDLTLDRTMPSGTFLSPAIATKFSADTFTLDFMIDPLDPVPMASVEFYIQTSNTALTEGTVWDNLNELTKLGNGFGLLEIPSGNKYYHLEYDNEEQVYPNDVQFWALLIDLAGNSYYYPAPYRTEISPYSLILDDYDGVYYLPMTEIDGVIVEDSITGAITSLETLPATIEIDLGVYVDGEFINLNTDTTYLDVDGTFSITWEKDLIPPELDSSTIPISYVTYSNADELSWAFAEQNFATAGNFLEGEDLPQIAFVFAEENNNFISLFNPATDSVYDWAILKYPAEYSSSLATEIHRIDYDNNGIDDLLIITESEMILVEFTTEGLTYTVLDFTDQVSWVDEDLNLANLLQVEVVGNQIYLGTAQGIYKIAIDIDAFCTLEQFYSVPYQVGQGLLTFDVGNIFSENNIVAIYQIGGTSLLVAWNIYSESWETIFTTPYNMVDKIAISELDTDEPFEILFGVYGFQGTDIVRADYDPVDGWTFRGVLSYEEITQIYDIDAGQLAADNTGRVIISSEFGNTLTYSDDDLITVSDTTADIFHSIDELDEVHGLYAYYELPDVILDEHSTIGDIDYSGDVVFFEESSLSLSAPVGYDEYTDFEFLPSNTYGFDDPVFGVSDLQSLPSDFFTLGTLLDSGSLESTRILHPFTAGGVPSISSLYADEIDNLGVFGLKSNKYPLYGNTMYATRSFSVSLTSYWSYRVWVDETTSYSVRGDRSSTMCFKQTESASPELKFTDYSRIYGSLQADFSWALPSDYRFRKLYLKLYDGTTNRGTFTIGASVSYPYSDIMRLDFSFDLRSITVPFDRIYITFDMTSETDLYLQSCFVDLLGVVDPNVERQDESVEFVQYIDIPMSDLDNLYDVNDLCQFDFEMTSSAAIQILDFDTFIPILTTLAEYPDLWNRFSIETSILQYEDDGGGWNTIDEPDITKVEETYEHNFDLDSLTNDDGLINLNTYTKDADMCMHLRVITTIKIDSGLHSAIYPDGAISISNTIDVSKIVKRFDKEVYIEQETEGESSIDISYQPPVSILGVLEEELINANIVVEVPLSVTVTGYNFAAGIEIEKDYDGDNFYPLYNKGKIDYIPLQIGIEEDETSWGIAGSTLQLEISLDGGLNWESEQSFVDDYVNLYIDQIDFTHFPTDLLLRITAFTQDKSLLQTGNLKLSAKFNFWGNPAEWKLYTALPEQSIEFGSDLEDPPEATIHFLVDEPMDLPASAEHVWTFDDTLEDSVGSNDVINLGGEFTTDRYGDPTGAINFASNEDHALFSSDITLDLATGSTLSWWFQSDDTNVGYAISHSSTHYYKFVAYNKDSYILHGETNENSQYFDSASGIDADLDWHFYSIVVQGDYYDIYVDGEFSARNSGIDNDLTLNALAYQYSAGYYDGVRGSFDDIMVFNSALSAEDINALYHTISLENTVSVFTGDMENGKNSIEMIQFDIEGEMEHLIWDARADSLEVESLYDGFDPIDHPLVDWLSDNQDKSFIQIWNYNPQDGVPRFENLQPQFIGFFDGQFGIRYQLGSTTGEFDFTPYLDDTAHPDYFDIKIRLVIDARDFLDDRTVHYMIPLESLSNLLTLDLTAIHSTVIYTRPEEDEIDDTTRVVIYDENYATFDFDTPEINPSSTLTLQSTFDLQVKISSVSLGVWFSVTDTRFIFGNGIADLKLYSPTRDEYITVASSSITPEYIVQGDDAGMVYHVDLTTTLYSGNQIAEFIDTSSGTPHLEGYIQTRWSFINNRKESIVVQQSIIQPATTLTASFSEIAQHPEILSESGPNQIEIVDINGDLKPDILGNDGSVELVYPNEAVLNMAIIATDMDDTLNPVFLMERRFTACLDQSAPHPEFVIDPTDLLEYSEILPLHIVDYSYDLDFLNLSYSLSSGGPYTLISGYEHYVISEESRFKFDIDLNTLQMQELEGDVWIMAELIDLDGYSGTTEMMVTLDYTDPRTEVLIDGIVRLPLEAPLVSLSSTISLNYFEGETVSATNIQLLTDEVVLVDRIYEGVWDDIEGKWDSLDLNLYTEFLMGLDLDGDLWTYTLRFSTTDAAGNVEDDVDIFLVIDDQFTITFVDENDVPIEDPVIYLQYGESITGEALDSRGFPIPEGFVVHLNLDGLNWRRVLIDDEFGHFSLSALSPNLLSEDIRYLEGAELKSVNPLDSTLSLSYEYNLGEDKERIVDSIHLPGYYSNDLVFSYQNLSLDSISELFSYEAIELDIFLPSVYNDAIGTLFSRINVQFLGINETYNVSFSYDNDALLNLFKASVRTYQWNEIMVKMIPFIIGIGDLKLMEPEFSLETLSEIRIIGTPNDIHPGYNINEPTASTLYLGVGSIHLVDLLNDATVQDRLLPAGETDAVYASPSFTIESSQGFFGNCYFDQTISILPRRPILNDPINLIFPTFDINSFKFSTYTMVENIIMEDFDEIYGTLNLGYFSIIGIDPADAIPHNTTLAVADITGYSSSIEFFVCGTPGVYSDVYLFYSGDVFHKKASYLLTPTLTISNLGVQFDWYPSLEAPIFEISIERDETTRVTGHILTEDFGQLLFPSAIVNSIMMSKIEANQIVEDVIQDIPGEAVIFEFFTDEEEWVSLEAIPLINNEFFELNLDTRDLGNFALHPGTYITRIRFLENIYFAECSQITYITILGSEIEMSIREINQENSISAFETLDGEESIFFSSVVYSESPTYEVQLTNEYDHELIENVPVWLSLGIVPGWTIMDEFDEELGSIFGDYLVFDNGPEDLDMFTNYYNQDLTANPTLYPFFNETSDRYETIAPLNYQMAMTDEQGIAQFNIDPTTFKNIVDLYSEVVDLTIPSVEQVSLYLRIFYSKSFDAQAMQIPISSYIGRELPTQYGNDESFVYDVSDPLVEIPNMFYENGGYYNPNYRDASIQGIVVLEKEDTMFLTSDYTVDSPSDPLYTSVVEIDLVNENPVLEFHDESNFLELYEAPVGDFSCQLEVMDASNSYTILNERFDGYDYYPYVELSDNESIVSFPLTENDLG